MEQGNRALENLLVFYLFQFKSQCVSFLQRSVIILFWTDVISYCFWISDLIIIWKFPLEINILCLFFFFFLGKGGLFLWGFLYWEVLKFYFEGLNILFLIWWATRALILSTKKWSISRLVFIQFMLIWVDNGVPLCFWCCWHELK